jgi:holdfast attachment protein HfaA
MRTFAPALAAIALSALALTASPALAQTSDALMEQPIGMEWGASERPFEPGTRDANGNRTVINGRILMEGSSLPLGLGLGESGDLGGVGQSMAVGNQLNVITNGSFNTVIVDSTQINNGDQNAEINGGR